MRQSPGSVRVQVLLEAEAIGVEAEAFDEKAASTSLFTVLRITGSLLTPGLVFF